MTEAVHNSYLQRYELKQQNHSSRSLGRPKQSSPSAPKQSSPSAPNEQVIQANSIGSTVGRLVERVDGIEVKLTSLINVVKLVQRYTETRDDQYQKEKQSVQLRGPSSACAANCAQIDLKIKEFEQMSRQVREQLRQMEQFKASYTFAPPQQYQHDDSEEEEGESARELEKRLRTQLDKKMEICINLITSNLEGRDSRALSDKINEVSFSLNQLENECRRNKMMLQKELDTLAALIKETSTRLPAYSRLTQQELPSKSPPKPLSKNSKSDKSISKGNLNRSAFTINQPKDNPKVKEQELRQALRRKKEHRDKLKVKNW